MTAHHPKIEQVVPDGIEALIVFDEVCVFCNGFAKMVARFDAEDAFRFTSAQGPIGQALYNALEMPLDDFETNLVIINGEVSTKLSAFIAVAEKIGGIWRFAIVLRVLPKPIANWLYDRIARNRYRVFGKYDACPMPTEEMKRRLI
ncbi:MAG: DCC1-like thiol-disulfide oxidoreductase family protein [Pseudomonadota bacterium]